MVKALRDRTGAGMMECKKALEAAGGDIEKGIEELRKRGIASAAKKTGRSAKQGAIVIKLSDDKTSGVIVEFNCESDFVARTDDFQGLVGDLADQALASAAVAAPADLLRETYAKDASMTIEALITAKVAKIGENMKLARLEKVSGGVLGAYIHPGAQLGVLIQASGVDVSSSEIQDLVRDVAMQIAAADPQFISRSQVTAADVEKEKEIQRERAIREGKPPAIVEKMLEGRMAKYYEEVCLLEQPFIKENSLTVGQMIEQANKKLGLALVISRFVRFKVGETAGPDAPEAE
ncbi:MAG: translation elongation factor Ts [Acidobacteria bacterium]|nr:translation elongation factor Ts [Bryobacteraceae bacterium CoA2 C42]